MTLVTLGAQGMTFTCCLLTGKANYLEWADRIRDIFISLGFGWHLSEPYLDSNNPALVTSKCLLVSSIGAHLQPEIREFKSSLQIWSFLVDKFTNDRFLEEIESVEKCEDVSEIRGMLEQLQKIYLKKSDSLSDFSVQKLFERILDRLPELEGE